MKLVINRCPIHKGFWAITIEDNVGGTRVTPSKCCGQWETVESWSLSARQWNELAEEAQHAAEQVAR